MKTVSTLCLLWLVLCALAGGQVVGTTAGIAPFGSYTADPLGSINAANLSINTVIPFRYKGQFFGALVNDNNRWTKTQSNGAWYWALSNTSFFALATNRGYYVHNTLIGGGACANDWLLQWWFIDKTGFKHIGPTTDTIGCGGYSVQAVATDPYGYRFNVSSTNNSQNPHPQLITDPSGFTTTNDNLNSANGTPTTDPNGNVFTYISTSTTTGNFIDYTGQTFLNQSVTGSGLASGSYSWTDSSGNTKTITASPPPGSSPALWPKFGCSGIQDGGSNGSYNQPTSISLPDGSGYAVTYEPTVGVTGYTTGRIASITLPSGATITYNYNGPHNGISCEDGGTSGFTRTTSDGTWTYSRSFNSTTLLWTTVITSPSGQKVTYTFTGGGVDPKLLEVRRVYSEANGDVTSTVDTCYNGSTNLLTCATTNSVSPNPPNQVTVFTEFPNSSGTVSRKDTFYNTASLVTRVDSYDFGTGAAGALLQKITYSYGSWNGSACGAVGSNIIDHVCQTTVFDGAGNIKTQVSNTYDSKGNLLTQKSLVSTGVYLTSSSTYNVNGTVATATDVNGTVGTYSGYQCNGQFPGSYAVGGLTTIYTWDCNGGVQTSIKDPNNQITNYAYNDPFWRPTSVTDPLGNVTTTSYAPTSVDTGMVFNSNGSTTETVIKLDGLGRKSLVQKRLSPASSLYDTVEYKYDINGHLLSVSQPCQVALGTGCTTAVTTTGYDALWRPTTTTDGASGSITKSYTGNDVLTTVGPAPAGENTKKRQLEYDGLSRLTSICEITAASGSVTCGQSTSKTGLWTRYQYDGANRLTGVCQNTTVPLGTDCVQSPSPGQQTRRYSYDGLGRLTSETNPESGTKSYVWDSTPASSCGATQTFNGDLVRTVDANGTNTCFYYDALHRLTDEGTNRPSIDGCKRFRYDNSQGVTGTMPAGVSVASTLGRLAEAETDACSPFPPTSATIITDEWFSYSARGETTDFYQSTPHSSGYYHVTGSYWANGQLNTLKGVSLPTITYGLDGEGRPKTVSASAGISPVSSTSYNPAGQVTDVIFGSSDPVHFGFDTMGRMTQYKLTINGTATHGDPTWNPNGTLGSLAITDPFNAADAQTCTYGYDDLARLASAHCGASIWQQDFTYDPFGNITKSGSISFQPGYNPANNHYANGATYDADGNLTNDGTDHTYTWDADGHPVTLDSRAMVYDALGREVELQNAGTNTEFVYGPTGKLALMNGQTQTKAFVPLPGGTQVKYAGNAISTYRLPDWLGSFRVGSNPNRTYSWGVAFAPFGEQYAVSGGAALSFTGEEGTADTVSDEYDFLYRKLHSAQGRWISPDPAGLSAADLANPQSWNRYSYVLNSPLNLIDPSGLDACDGSSWGSFNAQGYYGAWYGGSFGGTVCGSDEELGLIYKQMAIENILDGENSIGWPIGSGNPLTDLWQNALGLPTLPCQSQFGPWCDPGMLPNPWILDQHLPSSVFLTPKVCDNSGVTKYCSDSCSGAGAGVAAVAALELLFFQGMDKTLKLLEDSDLAKRRCLNSCAKQVAQTNKCKTTVTFNPNLQPNP